MLTYDNGILMSKCLCICSDVSSGYQRLNITTDTVNSDLKRFESWLSNNHPCFLNTKGVMAPTPNKPLLNRPLSFPLNFLVDLRNYALHDSK